MKITQLLNEMETTSSSTANATNSAPKFGRSDKFLEEKEETVEECSSGGTSAGSVASVAAPMGGVKRRGQGSMFQGIQTSAKFPNSKAVKEGKNSELDSLYDQYDELDYDGNSESDKEKMRHIQQKIKDLKAKEKKVNESQINEVDPRNFDSDVDYYAARNAPAKPRYRGTSSPGVNQDDEAYFREIFRKKRLAAQQQEREQDHDRLATGTNESEVEEGQRWPDSSNSLAKRSAVATNLKGAPSKAGRGSGMTVATRVDPSITSTKVQRKDDRPIPSFLQKEGEEFGSDAELKTWQVVIFNNYYAGKYSDYRGRYYYVLATSPEEAKQVVIDNADGILQELLAMKSQNGKKILPRGSAVRITPERIGKIEDGTVAGRMSTAGYKKMFGPQGPVMVKLSGGAVQDIQSQEQPVDEADPGYNKHSMVGKVRRGIEADNKGWGQLGNLLRAGGDEKVADKALRKGNRYYNMVRGKNKTAGGFPKTTIEGQDIDEASFDYTTKDLGNDYAGFPSNHSMKHKFLARIKPEKQQLYKDKMNNTHDWDSLFALFKVAKARGDIIEPGDSQPTMGLNASLEQHADDKMKELGSKFKPVGEARKANTASARAEFGKRPRKEDPVEQDKKKADSDEAWARLMAYADEQKKKQQGVAEEQVNEKSKSQAQFRTMAAVAHNPKFAKKVGISQKVGKEFHDADKKSNYKDLPAKVEAANPAQQAAIAIAKKKKAHGVDEAEGDCEGLPHMTKDLAKHISQQIDTEGPHAVEKSIEWGDGAAKELLDKIKEMLDDYASTVDESAAWQKKSGKNKNGGLNQKGVDSYRREHPGSHLQTAVTTKPSKLKPGSKAAKRRKSFCARMGGMKGPMKDEHGKPTRKALSLRKWNCESVEQFEQMIESHFEQVDMLAESSKQRLDPKCWSGYKKQGTKMKGGVRVNNCVKVDEAEVSEDKLASDLYKDLQIFKKGADKGIGSKAKDKEISSKAKDKDIVAKEGLDDVVKGVKRIVKGKQTKGERERHHAAKTIGAAQAFHQTNDPTEKDYIKQQMFKNLNRYEKVKNVGNKGVAEMDGDGAGRDGSNRKSHSTYGSRDKQHASNGPDIHLGSDSAMTSKDIQDHALNTLTQMLSKPENMNVLKRLKNK